MKPKQPFRQPLPFIQQWLRHVAARMNAAALRGRRKRAEAKQP